jgi:hypothetical protein
MALDAARRASIYEKLRPVLGDEDANLLMSEFPSIEAQELVTKDFLRAELALATGQLRSEMGDLRTGLRTEMAGLRTDMAALESRMMVRLGSTIAASAALQVAALGLLT